MQRWVLRSPHDALAQLRAGLENLTIADLTMGTLERLIALLVQIGLSLVVWRAFEKKNFGFLALAVLLHAVIDFPAGLFQAGQISSLMAGEPVLVVGAALAALFHYNLPRKLSVPPARKT
jgi:uncharacterized membrane protein YhfC